jgi:transcriptional regulator with PAS, ATPase and Fis domain
MVTLAKLVGASAAIREIEQEVEWAARSDTKVLLTGESGVGKEVVARLIHQESRRRHAPFVAINCAGVPDTLLESELFGHVRGSFTDAYRDRSGWIEQAQTGTIFLDEIGEMSSRMQTVLLRFLESGEIQPVGASRAQRVADVRVIAATNRDLTQQVAEKRFRDDLYYRLNVVRIAIPPLRERKEDIQALIGHFFRAFSESQNVPPPCLIDETLTQLLAYAWPGNVRELKNVAERLVVRARGGVILPADLPKEIVGTWAPATIFVAGATPRITPDRLLELMTIEGESFWTAVYEPFIARDLTRDDLRAVVSRGLEKTKGSYKQLLKEFNVDPEDYKRLLGFLRKYQCHLPFQKFRSVSVRPEGLRIVREPERDSPLVKAC